MLTDPRGKNNIDGNNATKRGPAEATRFAAQTPRR